MRPFPSLLAFMFNKEKYKKRLDYYQRNEKFCTDSWNLFQCGTMHPSQIKGERERDLN